MRAGTVVFAAGDCAWALAFPRTELSEAAASAAREDDSVDVSGSQRGGTSVRIHSRAGLHEGTKASGSSRAPSPRRTGAGRRIVARGTR